MNVMNDLAVTDVAPPGADAPRAPREPGAAYLRRVLVPRWRPIAISVAVTLALALAVLFALPKPDPATVKVVDPSPAIAQASAAPDFTFYLPTALPDAWHVNNARFDTQINHQLSGPHLHIGYLAPDHGYLGLEESTDTPRWRFVSTMTAGNEFQDLVTIDGQVWGHVVSNRKVQESLVWYGPDTAVVVTGTTSLANLKAFAASLRVGQ